MPWTGAIFTPLYDFEADAAAGPPTSLIRASRMMAQLNDIADGITQCAQLDGGNAATGNWNMNGWRLTALAQPTSPSDGVNKTYADTKLPLAGGTLTGPLEMSAQKITGLGNGTVTTDACAYGQLTAKFAAVRVADANTATTPGYWEFYNAGAQITNGPTGEIYGHVFAVLGLGGTDIAQTYYSQQSGKTFWRKRTTATWSAWTELATTAQLPIASSTIPAADGTAAVGVDTKFARADHVHPTDTTLAPKASPTFTGTVTLPTSTPAAALEAASKGYVDSVLGSVATGVDYKDPVDAMTTANIATLAGGAPSTLDGVALAVGSRILVKDQTTPSKNGIYVVSVLGAGANGPWVRATDADVSAEVTEGMTAFVLGGTVGGGRLMLLTTSNPIVLGTTSLVFTQINSGTLLGYTPVNKAGDTMTGSLSAPYFSASGLTLTAAAGVGRYTFQTTGSQIRWAVGAESTAESGSNAGSNYAFFRYDDAGTFLGTALTISRATGVANYTSAPTVGGVALASLASPTFTGTPTLPTGTIATTQAAGHSTTAVATTAFATAADVIVQASATAAAASATTANTKADNLVTLSGMAVNSTHLGTFTGTTIPDNSTVKAALQSLETQFEATSVGITATVSTAGGTGAAVDLGALSGSFTAVYVSGAASGAPSIEFSKDAGATWVAASTELMAVTSGVGRAFRVSANGSVTSLHTGSGSRVQLTGTDTIRVRVTSSSAYSIRIES